ncbi:unnamed protein product [Zymoseptoria tritici ST99CH_3D1]|nr:unnamed protein product [Zymoseptoria tritici ST99CH_3D1]
MKETQAPLSAGQQSLKRSHPIPSNEEHPGSKRVRPEIDEANILAVRLRNRTPARKPPGYSHLLNLRPELRNRIWEEVVVEEEPIDVDESLRQPGLLCVNRQVCSETRQMWCKRNTFDVLVQNCDARVFWKLDKLLPAAKLIAAYQKSGINIHTELTGDCNWANLLW